MVSEVQTIEWVCERCAESPPAWFIGAFAAVMGSALLVLGYLFGKDSATIERNKEIVDLRYAHKLELLAAEHKGWNRGFDSYRKNICEEHHTKPQPQ